MADVPAARVVAPVAARIGLGLLLLTFLIALLGAATSPVPFTSGMSAGLLAMAAVTLMGFAERIWPSPTVRENWPADTEDELEERAPEGES